MDKRKAAEGVKTAVIVLLLISLVFLAWKSGLFSGGIWRRGASSGAAQYGESGDVSDGGEISAEAARPGRESGQMPSDRQLTPVRPQEADASGYVITGRTWADTVYAACPPEGFFG